jgi:hypothetical protein
VGIQYIDELLSAIREAAGQLAMADTWVCRANESGHFYWRMSFLQAARKALDVATGKLGEATTHLAALGPADRLPSLFATLHKRLDELRVRLETLEKTLAMALDAALERSQGHA